MKSLFTSHHLVRIRVSLIILDRFANLPSVNLTPLFDDPEELLTIFIFLRLVDAPRSDFFFSLATVVSLPPRSIPTTEIVSRVGYRNSSDRGGIRSASKEILRRP